MKVLDNIKHFFINFWQADKGTQTRFIANILFIINTVLYIFHKDALTVSVDYVWGIITVLGDCITLFVSWWKDNPVTPQAKEAHEYMRHLKAYAENEDTEIV